jgi:hypothetical protein
MWLRDVHNISHCPDLKPVSKRLLEQEQVSVPVQVLYTNVLQIVQV